MVKRITIAFIFIQLVFMLLPSCSNSSIEEESMLILGKMSLKQKVGALMMVAVPGKEMNDQAREIIRRYHPGGVILFGYNIGTKTETTAFIDGMQKEAAASGDLPLFVSIDQEGGRVIRIVDGITQFPGNMAAGIAADPDLTFRWARVLGMQLRLLGVNMNLAPVLDVNNNPDNPVINTRSFGSDPLLVALLGLNYLRGLQESFCIAVGKHFPGHGDTGVDSHRALPSIGFDLERLRSLELIPFIRAIAGGVEGIMSAHISYPAILGNDESATISSFMLYTLLRKELGFRGMVITDDLEMKAISGKMDVGEGAVKAVLAGADIVLVSTHGKSVSSMYESLLKAVDGGRITPGRIDESVRRLVQLKLKYRIMRLHEGKILPAAPVYEDGDLALLKDADGLNRRISRKSILFQGDASLIDAKLPAVRMVVTTNPVLVKSLEKSTVRVLSSLGDKAVSDARGTAERCVLFYHMEWDNVAAAKWAGDFCTRHGIGYVLVASGNPFPLTRSGAADNYLLSFSNTDESIRQLGQCIKGDFAPKTQTTLNLGFPAPSETATGGEMKTPPK